MRSRTFEALWGALEPFDGVVDELLASMPALETACRIDAGGQRSGPCAEPLGHVLCIRHACNLTGPT